MISQYTSLFRQAAAKENNIWHLDTTMILIFFYRAMLRRVRLWHCMSSSVRLSVRPSVTLRNVFHTVWNTSKIISRPNSLRHMRLLTTTWVIWCNGNAPKIRVEYGWGQEHIKAAKSTKWCKIRPRLLLRTNRKSHTRFQLAPKSITIVWPWTAENSLLQK